MAPRKDVQRLIRLDAETDLLLTMIAQRYEDNRSLTMRSLIREAAAGERQKEAFRATRK